MYKVQVKGHIDKPVEEVFEAVVDPAVLSRYFTTAGARGRLEAGATVSWDFHDFPGEFPVYVLESTAPERVVMQWDAPQGSVEPDEQGNARTTVTFEFEPRGRDRTLVRITESGWNSSAAALADSYDKCEGWTGMLCAMKAWLDHGVVLREGFYK